MNLIRGGYASPASLFAASEPSGWYDPSDRTTLFQDNYGQFPVTAAGQTVGLVLDKSQGLVVGPELITNGDFSLGTTGWTTGTGWSIASGIATKIVSAANANLTQTSLVITSGKYYRVTYTLNYTAGGFVPILGGTSGPTRLSSGTYTDVILAGSTNTSFVMFGNTAAAGSVDNISIRLLAGNHATQATSTQRPTYQIDSSGLPYLSFDGVDDGMVTNTITPSIDKVQVFTGVRKLSDAAIGMFLEFSTNSNVSAGSLSLYLPPAISNTTAYSTSRGTALASVSGAFGAAPITGVITVTSDISGPTLTMQINGTQVATSAATQGTGNYLAYPLYIGRRGGSSLPFNGRIYSLIVRFGPNLTTGQITSTESWVNSKTGAY